MGSALPLLRAGHTLGGFVICGIEKGRPSLAALKSK
jgi:hypothetical protein